MKNICYKKIQINHNGFYRRFVTSSKSLRAAVSPHEYTENHALNNNNNNNNNKNHNNKNHKNKNKKNNDKLSSNLIHNNEVAKENIIQMSFPCLDKLDSRTKELKELSFSLESGPEPSYSYVSSGYKTVKSNKPLICDYGGILSEYNIAYETWGELNKDKSNAILIHTGLSASSHAKSHINNKKPGWWEKFIGPGAALDTNKYFIICTNVIGGCYGSTGPSSLNPYDNKRYATRFPLVSVNDMVRAQVETLLPSLGINKLYASVGSSMGGMQSLALASSYPDKVDRVVSISGCARSHPYSIALRFTQRQVLMADPNWNRGWYYDSAVPPHIGMKLAREIATVTYRSGPEWEQRFGRLRADPTKQPALCPDFLIETYLDHQGEKFCLEYDANSFIYVSKAMDLFDLGENSLNSAKITREKNEILWKENKYIPLGKDGCTVPEVGYSEQKDTNKRKPPNGKDSLEDLMKGMEGMKNTRTLIMGAASDILFPSWQQAEVANVLRLLGNKRVDYNELGTDISYYGHDTFLLAVDAVGGRLRQFLD